MTLQQDTKKNILIIGKNSRLWMMLSKHRDVKATEANFHAVSSQDIYNLSKNLLQQSFSHAVVFSYSNKMTQNMKLLRNLRLLVANIIYISTCSVIAADRGYPYRYPRIKRQVEIFARDAKLFKGLRIIRLGIVEGTFDHDNLKGFYKYTSLGMIARQIQWQDFRNQPVVIFENLFVTLENYIDQSIESFFFKIYRRILLLHPIMGGVLRPIDVIFRALGWNWYGYNCVVNYDSDMR